MGIEILGGIIVSLLGAIISFFFGLKQDKSTKPGINKRISQLEQITSNLKELEVFVESQKNRILEEEAVLNELESKKDSLKPIVDANQEIVDAIFDTQEKRTKKRRWVDWIMGFFIGVFASLLATYIYSILAPSI